jgi:hypothetical protein
MAIFRLLYKVSAELEDTLENCTRRRTVSSNVAIYEAVRAGDPISLDVFCSAARAASRRRRCSYRLTFGTISSLFGLSHGIIDQAQYSVFVAGVICSAVVPTLIANAFYLPHHLLPDPELEQFVEESDAAAPLRPVPRAAKRAT